MSTSVKQPSDVVAALDVGSSRVRVVIGRRSETGAEVLGCGEQDSFGINRGRVVDIRSLGDAIEGALEEAEVPAGCQIERMVVGVSGPHVRSRQRVGRTALPGGVVRSADVARAVRQGRRVPPEGQVLMHELVSEYRLDDVPTQELPHERSASHLAVCVHEVHADAGPLTHLVRACKAKSLDVAGMVVEPLACGRALLDEDERYRGTVLVDMGGRTTTVGIWLGGRLVDMTQLGAGGEWLTEEVSRVLHVSRDVANGIKERYGCALSDHVDGSEMIRIPGDERGGPRHSNRGLLAQVIEPCMEELFRDIGRYIAQSPWTPMLGGGYVLSGGAASLEGCEELAERVLDAPVRTGVPHSVTGYADPVREPRFSTAVGLLMHALHSTDSSEIFQIEDRRAWKRLGRVVREYMGRIF